MKRLALLAALILPAAAQIPRQASEGRLWLRVPAGQAPLQDVRVSSGQASPAPWEKDPAVRERWTDFLFPIRWWDWQQASISFTSPQDGEVEVVLIGPWAADPQGQPFRQEILWDDLTARGAELADGGFEAGGGWKAIFQPDLPATEWPLAGARPRTGSRLAATWQNRPLAQKIKVAAGRRVTLDCHARAATTPDFKEPRILGKNTPAHRALARLKRGVNLGNGWEADASWRLHFTPDDVDAIAAAGFDHIRVPIAWHRFLKPAGGGGWTIDPALLAELEPVLRRALEKNLHLLVDWHHFDDLTSDPAAHRARFVAGWETIARHFKSWPPALFLELLNEPRDALTTEVLNPIHADALAAIRRIDPERIVFVSPGSWGDVRELGNLRLPDGDDRVVVTVHCYAPFHFTHQTASWTNLGALKGIVYPGPPATPATVPDALKDDAGVRQFISEYNRLPAASNPSSPNAAAAQLDLARQWSDHFGRPVHLGEFGCITTADAASRGRYARDVRKLAEARGIPWAWWDWKASFACWDPKTRQFLLKDALFD